jgi:hypothetical protein
MPHLYLASEYCKKAYLHSEQKQMWVMLFFFLPLELSPAVNVFSVTNIYS